MLKMTSMLSKVLVLNIIIHLHQTTDVASQTVDNEYLFVCVAQTAYDSVVIDELDLVVGESYGILQTSPSGWWRAVNENGEEGWVPSNYFDSSDCTTPTAAPTRSPTAPTAEPTGQDCDFSRDKETPVNGTQFGAIRVDEFISVDFEVDFFVACVSQCAILTIGSDTNEYYPGIYLDSDLNGNGNSDIEIYISRFNAAQNDLLTDIFRIEDVITDDPADIGTFRQFSLELDSASIRVTYDGVLVLDETYINDRPTGTVEPIFFGDNASPGRNAPPAGAFLRDVCISTSDRGTASPTSIPSVFPTPPTQSPTGPTAPPTGATLSPTGPTQSPTAPTSSPTEPTNEPSAHPTPEPSDSMVAQDVCEFDTGLCESPRCSNSTLDDDALCEVQYPDGSGCQTCQQGSFKKSDNHLCVPCSIDNCVECTSYHGCQTCESGFSAKWDPSCGLKTCFSDECTLETEKCESTNCADAAVDDNVNCLNQQDFGCTQCAPGYFQKSFQHLCVECSSVIDGCEVCQDWSGCSQCAPGKHIFWDDACGLHICL